MFLFIFFCCFFSVNAGPPVFNDDNSNITANENEILKVRCSATGDPEPTYEWYNEHSQKVGPHLDPPIWVENGVDNGTLLIFNVTSKGHSGGYTCTAINSHGLRSKVFEVNIIGGREEETNIKVLNVSETSVAFSLVPHGRGAMFDLKYKEIYQNLTYYATFTDKDAVIKVSKLIASGQYSFNFTRRVTNETDKHFAVNLTVTLLPAQPEVIFHKISDGILTFSWFRVFDDFMRKTIDKYHLTYATVRMVGGRSWLYDQCKVSIEIPVCSSSQYTLANLVKNQWYEISLRAHTAAGYSEPFKNKIYMT